MELVLASFEKSRELLPDAGFLPFCLLKRMLRPRLKAPTNQPTKNNGVSWASRSMDLLFRYFSCSFHQIFLKLYENNGLGSPTMGCAQFADSAKFGILVNLLSIFRTNFGCVSLLCLQFSTHFLETLWEQWPYYDGVCSVCWFSQIWNFGECVHVLSIFWIDFDRFFRHFYSFNPIWL